MPQQVRGYRQVIYHCPRCLMPFVYQHILCLDPPDHLTGRGGPADTDLSATLQEYRGSRILIHPEPSLRQLEESPWIYWLTYTQYSINAAVQDQCTQPPPQLRCRAPQGLGLSRLK